MPKLRFASFESDSWNNYRLGNICSFEQGIQVDVELQSFKSDVNKVRFLRIENYTQNSRDFRYIPKDIAGKKSITKDELAVVRYGATAGYIGRGFEGVLANNLFKLIPNNETLDLSFFYHIMKSDKTFLFFQSEMSGGAMPALSFGIVKALKLWIPSSKVEQNKIAVFLSSVDKKISLLKEKHALLAQYKKGAMQKLFKQEIRFKDENGNPFPDWRNVKLSELLLEHKKRNSELEFGKEHVLSVSGELGIVNQIEHLGRSYAGVSVANYHVVHEGDIVYTKSPLKANPYGIIKSNQGKAGIVSTLYAVYSCKSTAYHKYLNYYFSIDDNVNKYLRPLVHKGAKNDMKINNQRVLIDPIFAPSIEEQKKIVSFLEALDQKLALVKQQIELTQTFKKGLLQQMFV